MFSPLSIFLRNLRLRAGLSQRQLADLIGYEQGYVSALELGVKSPSNEFIDELIAKLKLNDKNKTELDIAIRRSRRRFTLPADVSTETYLFCNELWEKIERLHPTLLSTIHQLVRVDDLIAERPITQPTRLRRNQKPETAM
jgi:transcriptional regulator with XRE-family HTH domain